MSGVKFTQVQYKGSAPALTDTLAGQTSLMIDTLSTSLAQVKGGRIRAVALCSPERSPLLPEVPTIAESGLPGYEVSVYNGLLGPAAMPREAVNRLSAEIAKIARDPESRERFGQQAI